MNMIKDYLLGIYEGSTFDVKDIWAMLLIVSLLVVYVFIVYRIVSKRNLYNKSMHIAISVIPYFIAAIVMSLQSDIVITLGTIGALAIIRFRTAIKDPVDMVYLLWSVFIGICCGCKLYALCIFTSLVVTVVLLLINILGCKLLANPYIVIINAESNIENEIKVLLKKYSHNIRLKSQNFTSSGVDFVYEISTKRNQELANDLNNNKNIKQFSIVSFDSEDII